MFKDRSNANLQEDMFKLSLWDTLTRRKTFDEGGHLHSELRRCLSVLDVMFIAVGHMIGAGIFVLTGSVVRNTAGPSIILSFLMAGFAALLSAFSYAEFGARFPRAGSAYTYAYVGVGELWAFIIGWTVLLEYMIGNAAVARSWSAYFDTLIGGRLSNFTIDTIGEMTHSGGFFSQYLDILAFLLIVAVAIAVALGSKASANVNTTFVLLNVTVLVIVIVCGFIYADFSLWFGSTDDGTSKFFPYGFGGTLAGAATCFFAFIGFEALGSASEEAKNPSRTIPMATFGSLTLVTTLYVLMAATLTLMLPYDQIHPSAAYAEAFASKGATIPKYVITVGALAGMINNLVTGAFALPRSVYAMADDGLIFKWFGRINKRTLVPLNAIIVFTLLNGIIAAVFDLEALVEFLSIGTLLAYSIVSACVIILRHQPAPIQGLEEELDDGGQLADWLPFRDLFSSWESSSTIVYGVVAMLASNFWLALCFRFNLHTHVYGMVMCGIAGVFILLAFTFILAHKQNSLELTYKVPFVPFIPSLGLLINCFMMAFLNWLTWVRMVVWMAIGLVIYFGYGIRHSKEGKKLRAIQDGSHRVPRHIAPPSVVKA